MGPAEISLCGRTNCARTDISALACTAKNSAAVSAVRKLHSACGNPAQRMVFKQRASSLETHHSGRRVGLDTWSALAALEEYRTRLKGACDVLYPCV